MPVATKKRAVKLVKAPEFNKAVDFKVEIPVPADKVGMALLVFVLKDGRVELHGPIADRVGCETLLKLALERLAQFHEKKGKADGVE